LPSGPSELDQARPTGTVSQRRSRGNSKRNNLAGRTLIEDISASNARDQVIGSVFTAEALRTQRVEVLFSPAVRGGRRKDSLSASGRGLNKALASKRRRLLLWRPLNAGAKNHLLCDLCVFAVSKGFVYFLTSRDSR
jgi:hypothetical protein